MELEVRLLFRGSKLMSLNICNTGAQRRLKNWSPLGHVNGEPIIYMYIQHCSNECMNVVAMKHEKRAMIDYHTIPILEKSV